MGQEKRPSNLLGSSYLARHQVGNAQPVGSDPWHSSEFRKVTIPGAGGGVGDSTRKDTWTCSEDMLYSGHEAEPQRLNTSRLQGASAAKLQRSSPSYPGLVQEALLL